MSEACRANSQRSEGTVAKQVAFMSEACRANSQRSEGTVAKQVAS